MEEWTISGTPRRGLNPTNATKPLRCGISQRSATRWVTSHVASTLSRCTARSPLVEVSSSGAANCPPALFTRTSTRPKRSPTASSSEVSCSPSRTSATWAKQAVAELLGDGGQGLGTPAADGHLGPGPRERAGRGPPDAGPAAGDQGDALRERVARQRGASKTMWRLLYHLPQYAGGPR